MEGSERWLKTVMELYDKSEEETRNQRHDKRVNICEKKWSDNDRKEG